MFLESSQYLQENTCAWARPANLFKRNSKTVFSNEPVRTSFFIEHLRCLLPFFSKLLLDSESFLIDSENSVLQLISKRQNHQGTKVLKTFIRSDYFFILFEMRPIYRNLFIILNSFWRLGSLHNYVSFVLHCTVVYFYK